MIFYAGLGILFQSLLVCILPAKIFFLVSLLSSPVKGSFPVQVWNKSTPQFQISVASQYDCYFKISGAV